MVPLSYYSSITKAKPNKERKKTKTKTKKIHYFRFRKTSKPNLIRKRDSENEINCFQTLDQLRET